MDTWQLDRRLLGRCITCGIASTTRDHVPAKVFLDDPLPEQYPVVAMCAPCNQGASLDEEYVACLIDVVVHGDATGRGLRTRIARSLEHSPKLRADLSRARQDEGGRCIGFLVDEPRLRCVLDKIGRGLWAYEVGEPAGDVVDLRWTPMQPGPSAQDAFLLVDGPQLFPEVGSGGFRSLVESRTPRVRTLQPGRFRYCIDISPVQPAVRMLFSEYLAVECRF